MIKTSQVAASSAALVTFPVLAIEHEPDMFEITPSEIRGMAYIENIGSSHSVGQTCGVIMRKLREAHGDIRLVVPEGRTYFSEGPMIIGYMATEIVVRDENGKDLEILKSRYGRTL